MHLGGLNASWISRRPALGCAYRDVLEVRNRGRVAARVSLKPPESLLGALDIVPDACFVQPGSVSRFSLKFKPDEALFAATLERSRASAPPEKKKNAPDDANDANDVGDLGESLSSASAGTVTAACSARAGRTPMPFTFKATLTRGDVRFDPPTSTRASRSAARRFEAARHERRRGSASSASSGRNGARWTRPGRRGRSFAVRRVLGGGTVTLEVELARVVGGAS